MAGLSRIGGIASAYIDGVAVTAKGNCEYKPNATKRDPVMGMDGTVVGYTEEGDAPYIAFDMLDTGVTVVADYYNTGGRQIIVQLANGKTVTGSSMTMMEPPVIKNDDATYPTKWIGVSVVESIARG
jgi:hypothetical protein